MIKVNNHKLQRGSNKTDNTMDHVPIVDNLNSDNAFSDNGLENALLLEESVKNKKSNS
ncbi:hypothetical protein J7E79_21415 [Bacillus sp. ISL-40]|uniref:hypothetical protein n=1 Tax=unclassified Bacillus (in: firmicutes) TaxID=185979 RepID=UPI001BE62D83|nr:MULTISPECIES: hypothetical protein [unclassified Bacillus (in: firmicutes)]MBT2699927.1 hypothetical protein [Bacillus sp. ISL-40]MBT2722946.1 hypothetical protein [Bacillus sp. ISL-46]MBT2743768.1 hypothetical protein [Bacillus sp. ISL-77]